MDDDNHSITNPHHIIPLLNTFYKKFFNQDDIPPIPQWDGDPRPLHHPISSSEVRAATRKLNNGCAAGADNTSGELYKYGGDLLHERIASTLNTIFKTHQHLKDIGTGILIAINKPRKKREASNTRPITLLNSIRKILSNILLDRIYPKLDRYISQDQSAFRKNRSTADILWTYRFYMAKAQKYKEEFHLMGIDLSKAFDCINRTLLLDIMRTEDETRILLVLLSNTTLQARVQTTIGEPFPTTIGVPQGDALSPVLFTVYLEAAMRYHKSNLPMPYSNSIRITHYADDTDFITSAMEDILITNIALPANFTCFNLQMNADKTCKHNATKKLGSKLSGSADIKHRITTAKQAFGQLWKLWLQNKHITKETKIRMYNACIKPILLYNTSSTPASDHMLEPIAATHRRHLRHLLGIFYPRKITNTQLYALAKSRSIIIDILESRLNLFGHLLRAEPNTPSHKAMEEYFTNPRQSALSTGRRQISLPQLLDNDLQLINRRFKTHSDLRFLQHIAADRAQWHHLVQDIVEKRTMTIAEELARATASRKRTMRETIIRYEAGNHQTKRLRLTAWSPLILRIPKKRHIQATASEDEEDNHARYRIRRSLEADLNTNSSDRRHLNEPKYSRKKETYAARSSKEKL